MLNEKFWEKYFKVYDVLNIIEPYQKLMEELENELGLKNNDIVLDVGSGTGNLMTKIKNKCKKTIGIDYSKEGQKIHRTKDRLAEIYLCDITKKFPFSDNYFSKIVSNNTIYTLTSEQQDSVLSEIYRVLMPKGKFVISNVKKGYSPIKIYSRHILQSIKKIGFSKTIFLILKMLIPTLKMFYYNAIIKKSGGTNHYYFLSQDEQKKLLKKSGFTKISKTKYVYADQAVMNSCYKL